MNWQVFLCQHYMTHALPGYQLVESSLYRGRIAAQLFEGCCYKRIAVDTMYKRAKGEALSWHELSSEHSAFSLVRREHVCV